MDKISIERRSANMRAIRSKDTSPEITVRKMLRAAGFAGYRVHRKELPGRPDIAFIGKRKAIFVHGCFWHGHDCREGVRRPRSNSSYWVTKISGNKVRDERHRTTLEEWNWSVFTVWACEIGDSHLSDRLFRFVADSERA